MQTMQTDEIRKKVKKMSFAYSIQVPISNPETQTKLVLLSMVLMLVHSALHLVELAQIPNTVSLPGDHRALPPILPHSDDPTVKVRMIRWSDEIISEKIILFDCLPFSEPQFRDRLDPMVMYLFSSSLVLYP